MLTPHPRRARIGAAVEGKIMLGLIEVQRDGITKWYVRYTASSAEEAVLMSYSFFRDGATNNPEMVWHSDLVFTFMSTEAMLFDYFARSCFNRLLNEQSELYKGVRGGVLEPARRMAVGMISTIKYVTDIRPKASNGDILSLGAISAERPDCDYTVTTKSFTPSIKPI